MVGAVSSRNHVTPVELPLESLSVDAGYANGALTVLPAVSLTQTMRDFPLPIPEIALKSTEPSTASAAPTPTAVPTPHESNVPKNVGLSRETVTSPLK